MQDKEIMNLARDMLKDTINRQILLEKIIKVEDSINRAKIKIKQKKFRGTVRTLSNDELAHNGALNLSIQILNQELNSL